ncbi:MAG: hypothetical protein JRH04_15815 [Deltaproteobacteria bacterium]|nr:hypothetical protein [Deltaproteobacteria bacterium]
MTLNKKIMVLIFICSLGISFPCLRVSAEEIQGEYCYTTLETEPLMVAKEISYALALRAAVKKSDTFKSLTKDIEDFRLKKSIGVGQVKVLKQDIQGRTSCTELVAQLDTQILKSILSRKVPVADSAKPKGFEGLLSNEYVKILNYKKEGSFLTILYQAKQHLEPDSVEISILCFDNEGRQIKRTSGLFPLRPVARGKVRWASLPLREETASFELKLDTNGRY